MATVPATRITVRAPSPPAPIASDGSNHSFYTLLALSAVFVLYAGVALELTPLPTEPLPEDVFDEQPDRFARPLLCLRREMREARLPGGPAKVRFVVTW